MISTDRDFPSFGILIKSFRTRRHLTQQQLAEAMGLHRHAIGRWEQGSFLPRSKETILELATVLHLDDQETRSLLEASLTALSPYWYVPLPRNPYFTGREEILEALHTQLDADQAAVLTQSSALHGLGGVGKTQIALEYVYRHALEYSAVFWIGAETKENIISSLLHIAETLQLPGRNDKDQQQVIAAVQRWLTTHGQWLLIWDNVEDLCLLDSFLPSARSGAILITTRCQALGTFARGVDLLPMKHEEGMLFLLRRAKLLAPEATDEQACQLAELMPSQCAAAADLVMALGGLPLALDQAGAYIEETGCSPMDYLRLYEHQQAQLLARRGTPGRDHPRSVATTFRLALEQVEQKQSVATDLLRVCAFLHAESIPEELFTEGAAHLGPELALLATDLCQLDQAIAVLRNLSLVQRQAETRTLSMHRLVQAVLYEWMSEQERALWLRRLTTALNALFPEDTSDSSKWERCERLLAHVLTEAAAIPDHAGNQTLVQMLRKAADYLREHAQYKQAEQLYRRAVHVGEQQLGPEHPDLAPALDGLAALSQEEGKHEQAVSLAQRALHLSERALGSDHLQVAFSLNTLARIYVEQGMYEQAEPLYQQALRIWEQRYGPDYPHVASCLNDLALLYWRQGRYELAEPLLQRAIHFWKQTRGPESLQAASPLNNLALLYWKQGMYEQAEPLFLQALRIWEQEYGPEHPIRAYGLSGLAIVYSEQGKYEQAEPLFEQVLHIWEQTQGPEHHQVAIALFNLGEVAASRGKYEQAEALYQRALHIKKQVWGPEHPQVAYALNSLADLSMKQERYEQAEEWYQQVLSIWERGLGPDHPDVAYPLNGLANLASVWGKTEQAEALYKRALHLREQHLGQDHPETAETLHDLAIFRQKQGHLNEALSLAERTLKIRSQSLGDVHPKTITTQTLYDQLLQEEACTQREADSARSLEELPDSCREERHTEEASLTLHDRGDSSLCENDPLQEFLDAC